MKNILFVHYGEDWIRGSEVVLLDLLKSCKQENNNPILWCNSSVPANEARKQGVRVIQNNFVCLGYWILPKWNVLQFVKLLIKAKRIIKQYSIDIVHCNNGGPCQWMAPVCKYTQTPLLLHLHARYQQRDRYILLFHWADKIVGVSKAVIGVFQPNEVSAEKLLVIHNGVSESRVKSKRPMNIRAMVNAKPGERVVMFIGSLIARKGVDTLIKAASIVIANRYSIKVAIFGDGEQQEFLVKLIVQFGLQDKIFIFAGSDDVATLFSANVDYFVSTPTEEVFGLTLAEASLAQLPIVSTNVAGVNEIYSDKVNALLVTSGNESQLAKAITTLVEQPELSQNLACKAREHVLKNFTLTKQANMFEVQYENLDCAPVQSILDSAFQMLFNLVILLIKRVKTSVNRAN